jgi:hypothetical protein
VTSELRPEASTALCPNCHEVIRDNLRYERVAALQDDEASPAIFASILFCGACGTVLSATAAPTRMGFPGDSALSVVDPADPESLAGQFQIRCRDLIREIQQQGFGPGGWIGLINHFGAVGAAKKLIGDHRILPVTRWLVTRGRSDLTMEHEVGESRWAELFTQEERDEAARRLAEASNN